LLIPIPGRTGRPSASDAHPVITTPCALPGNYCRWLNEDRRPRSVTTDRGYRDSNRAGTVTESLANRLADVPGAPTRKHGTRRGAHSIPVPRVRTRIVFCRLVILQRHSPFFFARLSEPYSVDNCSEHRMTASLVEIGTNVAAIRMAAFRVIESRAQFGVVKSAGRQYRTPVAGAPMPGLIAISFGTDR
jgi:hypothetical protein